MPANNCKGVVHYWAGCYGGLGHLYSPGDRRTPVGWLPYALDNGAFSCWTDGRPFDEDAFRDHVRFYVRQSIRPLWLAVPDVVADRGATLENWKRWAPLLAWTGLPLAFVAQDGMTFDDVPPDADVVFIGGTTDWKRAAIAPWCKRFPRVHVGRINTERWLDYCAEAGAESCDGTGWFRGDKDQLAGLESFLRRQAQGKRRKSETTASLFP